MHNTPIFHVLLGTIVNHQLDVSLSGWDSKHILFFSDFIHTMVLFVCLQLTSNKVEGSYFHTYVRMILDLFFSTGRYVRPYCTFFKIDFNLNYLFGVNTEERNIINSEGDCHDGKMSFRFCLEIYEDITRKSTKDLIQKLERKTAYFSFP